MKNEEQLLTTQQLQSRIHELEAEVKKLNLMLQKDSKMKYGLRWVDVPEAFEKESENKIPILEEIKENAIKNEDGKPTHVLIEGDNYHALKCLNYTHKGKIDVIYIDPPYNTGKEFVYKDKRVFEKYPNGQTIDSNHPLRHSTWLSFMSKRLELAKNLLTEKGVIFISIDDNEQANLKLLCDRIFGEKNFVGNIVRATGTTTGQDSGGLGNSFDYLLCYRKTEKFLIGGIALSEDDKKRYNLKDDKGNFSILQLRRTGGEDRRENRPTMYFPIKAPDGTDIYPIGPGGYESRWRVGPETVKERLKNNELYFQKDKNGEWKVYYKYYLENRTKRPSNLWTDIDGNKKAQIEIKDLFFDNVFDTPKPIELIERILQISTLNSQFSIILDFFAGSGTTLHAVMKLNASDGGNRQCILVQQDENGICRNVTYERNRRVMQGYENSKGENVDGLGNSLKYYKTAFVGQNQALYATDTDKVALAQKAGCLLSLAENTLDEIATTNHYQIFKGENNRYTGVYFTGNADGLFDFCRELEKIRDKSRLNRISAYFYCTDNGEEFENEFNSIKNIKIKTIPEPILKVYRALNI